jgi:hypothetical protein
MAGPSRPMQLFVTLSDQSEKIDKCQQIDMFQAANVS